MLIVRLVEHALTVPISTLANAKKKDVLVKGWGEMKVDKTIKRVNGMILDSIGFAILFSN
jgi:hypothetical protein